MKMKVKKVFQKFPLTGRKVFLEIVSQTLINQGIYRKRFLHF